MESGDRDAFLVSVHASCFKPHFHEILYLCNSSSSLLEDIVHFGPLSISVSLSVLKRVY